MHLDPNKIKQCRQENGWTQPQLAEACGVSLRTIQRVESTGVTSIDTASALAAVFKIENRELFKRQPEKINNAKQPYLVGATVGFLLGVGISVVIGLLL